MNIVLEFVKTYLEKRKKAQEAAAQAKQAEPPKSPVDSVYQAAKERDEELKKIDQ